MAAYLSVTEYPNRQARLGELAIWRALPNRERRMVGPWCFLDRFGPHAFTTGRPMDVRPHPHIGLQTVSWLLEGEVLHCDSLGSEVEVRPGGVNVMTAGRGISHTEETPTVNSGQINGVQLWTALPEHARNMAPAFVHVPQVPAAESPGGIVRVFAGSACGVTSPELYFSDITGLELEIHPGARFEMEIEPAYEHAVQILAGDCSLESKPLNSQAMYYLGASRSSLFFSSREGARILLIGGAPFQETILMWWNFVARRPEEIAAAREDWETGSRFGQVVGVHGARIPAPGLLRFARPNPAS